MPMKTLPIAMPPEARTISPQVAKKALWLDDESRRLSCHVLAGSGSGKSRLVGRTISFFDTLRGAPQVIIDPTGGTIDNLLDQVSRLPTAIQNSAWSRIRYVDLGAPDYITPFPLYYNLSGSDSLATIANRVIDTIERADPELSSASIEGMNAIREIGTYGGMLVAKLGLQITDTVDLIRNPTKKRWTKALDALWNTCEEAHPAIDYLREFGNDGKTKPEIRRRRSASFLNKLTPILTDPAMQALFASPTPGITMQEVDHYGLTLLIDGRSEHTAQRRQFKLIWMLRWVTDYLKHRGFAGRVRPISLVIDEVSQLLGLSSMRNDAMAEDIEELISVLSRNYGCLTTILHQSLLQINEARIQGALMSMGSQIIGIIHSPEDREYLAKQFFDYDPLKVKKRVPSYFNNAQPEFIETGFLQTSIFSRPNPIVLDHTTEEYSIDEQQQLLADRFKTLKKFQFLVRMPAGEGTIDNRLRTMSIADLAVNQYPDEVRIAELRQQLKERDGVPIATLLHAIRQRAQQPIQLQPAENSEHAILENPEENHEKINHRVSSRQASFPKQKAQNPDRKADWKDAYFAPAQSTLEAGQ